MHFQPNTLYRASDPRLLQLLSYSTLAQYRHRGEGPPYIKVGNRVFYRGEVLNDWLESKTVKPNGKEN